jgi:hypothetical protein
MALGNDSAKLDWLLVILIVVFFLVAVVVVVPPRRRLPVPLIALLFL